MSIPARHSGWCPECDGWALVPLIDFPAQTCTACSGERPGAPCPQEVLPL